MAATITRKMAAIITITDKMAAIDANGYKLATCNMAAIDAKIDKLTIYAQYARHYLKLKLRLTPQASRIIPIIYIQMVVNFPCTIC